MSETLKMSSNQYYIDSLTSHISLYHSSSTTPASSSLLNPNPRSSILKWFSSLTLHQRQSTLTIISHNFTQLLLKMINEINLKGKGCFLVLSDIPSDENSLIPSLCYKKIKGLLCRVSEKNDSERVVRESVRLFWSREGERVEECACDVRSLDSLILCEDFVSDVDRFVEVMDEVSNRGFLRGEVGGLGGVGVDWTELGWLKDKGYYSLEAFVANRVEVALRMAWLDRNNGKKRGGKVKVDVAGVAANLYWRKKGCVDWWENLDGEMKRKVLTAALGKTARALVLL